MATKLSATRIRALARARGLTLHSEGGRWILSRHEQGKGPDARPARETLATAAGLAEVQWALEQLPRARKG